MNIDSFDQSNSRRLVLYRQALAGATLGLLLLSWPLWLDLGSYPRIPFVRGWPGGVGGRSDMLAWLLAIWLAAATWPSRSAAVLLPALAVFGFAIVGDQNRLQPWVYQFVVVGLGLILTGPAWGLRFAAWFHAGLYFHSGLSKLDWTFAHELGPALLSVPTSWFGTSPAVWSESTRSALALALPAIEIVLALFLIVPRLRTLGLWVAVLMHLGILAMLGPWGLDHGATVLGWNAALLIEEVILFWPRREPASFREVSGLPIPVRVLLGAVLILPFFERFGLWDTWPSFAVYASHNERAEIYLSDDDRAFWPGVVAPFIRDDVGQGPWRRVDLLAWTRSAQGVPPYPQVRSELGAARALLADDRAPRSIRVVIQGRADRWTGQRSTETIRSREALDRRMRRFWLNAWPAPGGAK